MLDFPISQIHRSIFICSSFGKLINLCEFIFWNNRNAFFICHNVVTGINRGTTTLNRLIKRKYLFFSSWLGHHTTCINWKLRLTNFSNITNKPINDHSNNTSLFCNSADIATNISVIKACFYYNYITCFCTVNRCMQA